jgi:cob(I)alamin adenosyltransferase
MKLYTKTGDDGSTGLFGGKRVAKNSRRIQTIGDIDETNSAIGIARAISTLPDISDPLLQVQNRLFEAGADIATPIDARSGNVIRLEESRITEIEAMIDKACLGLPEMKSFILPGGTQLASQLHLARSICRRAERATLSLAQNEDGNLNPFILIYLNRLSDLLFALARRANHAQAVDDIPWLGRKS